MRFRPVHVLVSALLLSAIYIACSGDSGTSTGPGGGNGGGGGGGGSEITMPITGLDGLSVARSFFLGLAGPQGWIMGYGQDGVVAIDFSTGSVVRTFVQSIAFLSGVALSPFGTSPAPNGSPAAQTGREAIVGYTSSNMTINYWDSAQNAFGATRFLFGGASDAAPYNDDAGSGGMVYAQPGAVKAIDYDAAGQWLVETYSISSGSFAGLAGNFSSAFARNDSSSVLVVSDEMPGRLYLAPRPAAAAKFVGTVGDVSRQVRCVNNVCVVSCFGSDSLWTATWDAADNVAIADSVGVGDGPIGIDLLDLGNGTVGVVSTGFNDNTFSITVVGATGTVLSNTTQAVPTGCTSPPHAVWVPGTRSVLISCNGSNKAFIVPSGL